MDKEIEEPDFELRSVVRAYRTPVIPALCITALHAGVLYFLGHRGVAALWLLAMIPIDGLAYLNVRALLRRGRLQVVDIEMRLALFVFIRFIVIMSGPAAACFIRPGSAELIFLLLSTAIRRHGSRYRVRLSHHPHSRRFCASPSWDDGGVVAILGFAVCWGHIGRCAYQRVDDGRDLTRGGYVFPRAR